MHKDRPKPYDAPAHEDLIRRFLHPPANPLGGLRTEGKLGFEKIPVKGILGGVVALGIMATILIAVPAARWFLLLSLPAGVLVGAVLYFVNRRRD